MWFSEVFFGGFLESLKKVFQICSVWYNGVRWAICRIESFVNWYRNHKETQKPFEYGFPINGITDADTLLDFLQREEYKYWEINASVGLDGFVIAKNMIISNTE